MLNKDDISLKLGHWVPIWLQTLVPISELCTLLYACVNIIIYKYITSIAVSWYCPSCVSCCFRGTTTVKITSSLPDDNLLRNNTPEGNQFRNSSDNIMNMDIAGLLSRDNINRSYIQTEEYQFIHSSDHAISMGVVNESCTFQLRRQEQE